MSQVSRSLAAVCALALILTAPAALAAGSKPQPSDPNADQKSPQEQAIEHYNNGLGYRDAAWKLEKSLDQVPEAKLAKTQKKVQQNFESAAREFRAAVRNNPAMYQAHSGLGYALRRTGNYDEALAAYNKALELEPNYTEAIEYRAEAYLALNRIDDAKAAFDVLVEKNQQHAAELLEAMKKWVVQRKTDPAGMSTQQVNEMELWIRQRATTMSDTIGHAMPRKDGRW